ncbi:MAG: M28 family peptidase [Bacteroidota bacterium]
MKKLFSLFLFAFFSVFVFAQDIKYVRTIIDSLCSPHMHGRGYVNNGQAIAADFIAKEFAKDSLCSFGENYFQKFSLSLCTLPGSVECKTGRKKMKPGTDYLFASSSSSVKGKFKVLTFDSLLLTNKKSFEKFLLNDFSDKFVLIDKNGFHEKKITEAVDSIIDFNIFHAKGIIVPEDKLVWGVEDALYPSAWTKLYLKKTKYTKKIRKISVHIDRVIEPSYEMKNVIGYIKGNTKPDSFIVFTAHYDHLGQMGKDVYFPGANDNASGVALMLNLAKYYSVNKPVCSVVFIALTGEELGLRGSFYFVQHPLFPLSGIRFLINLDLVGTGDDGIKVVNGTIFQKEFDLLTKINDEKNYLKTISERGEAAISDHYPFYAKGVKSFYIYTLGGIAEYHNIYDKSETLPLKKYNEVFMLITDFVKALQ